MGICVTGSEERSGLWEQGWLQAGSIEAAEGREKRRTRPINAAIVANQDHPGRGCSLDLH